MVCEVFADNNPDGYSFWLISGRIYFLGICRLRSRRYSFGDVTGIILLAVVIYVAWRGVMQMDLIASGRIRLLSFGR